MMKNDGNLWKMMGNWWKEKRKNLGTWWNWWGTDGKTSKKWWELIRKWWKMLVLCGYTSMQMHENDCFPHGSSGPITGSLDPIMTGTGWDLDGPWWTGWYWVEKTQFGKTPGHRSPALKNSSNETLPGFQCWKTMTASIRSSNCLHMFGEENGNNGNNQFA